MIQNANTEWYRIENIDELDSPALVVYPDRVKSNIRTALAMVGDAARLRPHAKTHKSPDATRLQIAEGISKFKCATIAEAEMLAMAGASDVLLAYQPVGPKIRRLRALTRKYPKTTFSCLIDDITAAASIAEAWAGEHKPLRAFVDLNVGMNRTGLPPGPAANQLFRSAGAMNGIRPVGLHAYDGHIDDRDLQIRTRRCEEAFAPVFSMKENRGPGRSRTLPSSWREDPRRSPSTPTGRTWNAAQAHSSTGTNRTWTGSRIRAFFLPRWWFPGSFHARPLTWSVWISATNPSQRKKTYPTECSS